MNTSDISRRFNPCFAVYNWDNTLMKSVHTEVA